VADAWEIFARHGSDAVRWSFFSGGSPWTTRRISDDGIRETARTTLFTLWNVLSFFATYADLDGWSPEVGRNGGPAAGPTAVGVASAAPTHVLDRWIRAELDDTTAAMTAALDDFDALAASTRLARFVDDLSNWYLRRSRRRFWKQAEPAAHATLHHALVTTARLLAPFCPFLADEVHRVLCDDRSVHLADWPEAVGEIDRDVTARMAAARRLVTLGRAARTDAKVKVRQPLRRALLLHPGVELDDAVRAEIREELNVRALEDVDTLSGLITWDVVPRFRALGPRLGPRVADVKSALAAADGSALRRELEAAGAVEVAGIRLTADEVEVRARRHESFALAEDGGWAVALDLELDDDLRREGVARELIRALNDLRKERGLLIADRVRVRLGGDDAVREAVAEHAAWIADEVLAVELTWADGGELTVRVDQADVSVALEPAV
jgi:isoleucyl-tRNA synthetase